MLLGGQRWRTLAIVAAGAMALACGPTPPPAHPDVEHEALVRPGHRAPTSELERAILAHLSDLSTGNTAEIDGRAVVIGPPYAAASGRSCRRVAIQGTSAGEHARSELACLFDGTWSFVPSVLGDAVLEVESP
jgi:hypothetical protein